MNKILTLTGFILSFSTFAEIPYTFTAGTPAVASEVNQNFKTIDNNINSALTQTENNTENIVSANAKIIIIENGITNNASDITSTNEQITVLANGIVGNTLDVLSANVKIITLENDITSNVSDIASTNAQIGTLESDIISNTLDVLSANAKIIILESDITSNASDIASTNEKTTTIENDITSNTSDILSANAKITLLEGNIAALPECNNLEEWGSSHHQQVTYEPKLPVTGEALNFNSRSYRIVNIPIVEFSTGDVYSIKFPAEESAFDEVSGYVFTEHVRTNVDCSQFTISGFPAYSSGILERRTTSFANNGSRQSSKNLWVSYGVSIKIGETNLAIHFTYTLDEEISLVNHSDYDFTDNFGTPIHRTNAISMVDDWIDYIQITKVP